MAWGATFPSVLRSWLWLDWRGALPGARLSPRQRPARGPAPRPPAGRVPGQGASGPAASVKVPPRTSKWTPHEDARDVFRYRGGDQDLLGGGDEGGEAVAAARVELGEHVVEYQDRVPAACPGAGSCWRGGGERARPRLAGAGVAAGRESADAFASSSSRCGLIQADAAVEIARAHLEQRREQLLLRATHLLPVARAGVIRLLPRRPGYRTSAGTQARPGRGRRPPPPRTRAPRTDGAR